MSDDTLLNLGDVTITTSRFVVGKRTYTLNGITQVEYLERMKMPAFGRSGFPLIGGVGFFATICTFIVGIVEGNIGGAIVGSLIFFFLSWKMFCFNNWLYSIVLHSSSGAIEVFEDEDKECISKIFSTLNTAIGKNNQRDNVSPVIHINNYNTINTGKTENADSEIHEPVPAQKASETTEAAAINKNDVMRILLNAAMNNAGRLSVTQGVIETGLPFSDVESILKGMLDSGYVHLENNVRSGVIEYVFKEII